MVAACGGGGAGDRRGPGLDRRPGGARVSAACWPRATGAWPRGQTSVAVEAFSGAVALKPQSMLPYLKRGDTYLHRQDWAAAERDLRQATTLDPTAPQPLERLGDVAAGHRAAGRGRGATIGASLAHRGSGAPRPVQARAGAVPQGRHGRARSAPWTASLQLDASSADARITSKAWCSRPPATSTRRARRFERAIELAPAEVRRALGLADLHAARGRDREELALRESAAALDTAGPAALMNVARAYAAKGRSDQAIAALTRAADQHPGSSAVQDAPWDACGSTWPTASRDTAALGRALALLAPMAAKPDASSETLTLYGRALLLDGSLIAAERVLERATLQFPIAPDAFALLGEAAARRGHRAAAELARRKQAALDVLGIRGSRLQAPGPNLLRFCLHFDLCLQVADLLGDLLDGSRTSRNPSPRKLNPSTSAAIARPGKMVRCGASSTCTRP